MERKKRIDSKRRVSRGGGGTAAAWGPCGWCRKEATRKWGRSPPICREGGEWWTRHFQNKQRRWLPLNAYPHFTMTLFSVFHLFIFIFIYLFIYLFLIFLNNHSFPCRMVHGTFTCRISVSVYALFYLFCFYPLLVNFLNIYWYFYFLFLELLKIENKK